MEQKNDPWCVHAAAREGKTSGVKALLQQKVEVKNLNTRDQYGFTPLHYASIIGDTKLALLLLSSGINTEVKANCGQTALHLAAQHGHSNVVWLLVQRGCDLNVMVESVQTVLALSDVCGHSDATKELVRNEGWTALHYAAANGHTKIVSLLVDRVLNKNAVSETGQTALHLAFENQHYDSVEELLKSGCDANFCDVDWRRFITATDDAGRSAFHYAAAKGHCQLMRKLCSKIQLVDKNVVDSTPARNVYQAPSDSQCANGQLSPHSVVENKKLDSEKRKQVCTFSMTATQNAHEETYDEKSASYYSDVENGDVENYYQALHAVEFSPTDPLRTPTYTSLETDGYLEALFEYCAETAADSMLASCHLIGQITTLDDVNRQDNRGTTPLMDAAANGHEGIAQCLLAMSDCDVNMQNISNHFALYLAAQHGHTGVVRLLLDYGCDVNTKDRAGETALHRAAWNGHANVILELVRGLSDVNAEEEQGWTALHAVSRRNFLHAADILLASGSDVNAATKNGCTALHIGAANGHLRLVQKLIEAGADVDIKNGFGASAFHLSARNGHSRVMLELIKNSCDINSRTKSGDTALHYSAKKNRLRVVDVLIKKRIADVDASNSTGRTALHMAAKRNHAHVAAKLMDSGCDVNVTDTCGWTALHYAAANGHTDVLALLLFCDHYLDVVTRDQNRQTALHLAAQNKHYQSVELLLRKGCDVNLKDAHGHTALYTLMTHCDSTGDHVTDLVVTILNTISFRCERENRNRAQKVSQQILQLAVVYKHWDVVELLLNSSADAEGKTVKGLPLLCRAIRSQSLDVVNFILPWCDFADSDGNGLSALHHAAAEGRCDVIDVLLRCGHVINVQDRADNSPIMKAAEGNHREALHKLLVNGANVNMRNKDGYSALHRAVKDGNMEIAAQLIEHRACNLKLRTKKRETALHFAALAGFSDIVQKLLSKEHSTHKFISDKDIADAVDIVYQTLQMSDVRYKSGLQTVLNKFVACDVSGTNTQIDDVYAQAIEIAPTELCEKLLQRRPQFLHSQFADGETALHCAVRIESYKKCKLLLENGFGFDISQAWNNQTALEYAMCHNTDSAIVDLLLTHTESDDAVVDACKAALFDGESLSSLTQRVGSRELAKIVRRSVIDDIYFHSGQKLSRRHTVTEPVVTLANTTWTPAVSTTEPLDDAAHVLSTFNKPQTVSESKAILLATRKFLSDVSGRLRSQVHTSSYVFTPMATGSTVEDTKTYTPNEIDFICEFTSDHFTDLMQKVDVTSAGVYIPCTDDPKYETIPPKSTNLDVLDPRAIADDFYKAFSRATIDIISENVSYPPLVLHKSALQLRDKISCLHLMWTGDVFNNTMIYVDLVPAFKMPTSFKPAKLPPLCNGKQPSHVIAKKSRHNYSDKKEDCFFSFSFSLHENEFIQKLPDNIRLGYTLAKAVRIAAISKPSDLSGLTLDEDEKINSEDVITTYMLKTCLMTIYEEHKKNRSKMKAKQVIWTKMIYEKLREFIHNRELKTYYGDGVLFQCGDHVDDDRVDRVCCQKRLLILRMCDAILTWLNENRRELKDRLSTSSGKGIPKFF